MAPSPTTSASSADASSAADNADSQNGDTLNTVVVTARKRSENLQDVPIPVTVLGGNNLEKEGFYRIDEIQQKLPSVNYSYQNPRQSSLAIRGLGNNPANDGFEASSGVFLDGVYLGRPGMFNADMIDIDRLELLRGPQGTLFGKNTTAGLLNVTTREPSFTPEITGEASYGEYNYYQLRGYESDALIENELAQRISIYKTQQSGFVTDAVNSNKYDGPNREGVRGQLLYTPSSSFKLRIIADYNHEKDASTAPQLYNAGVVNYSLYPIYGTKYYTKTAQLGIPPPPDDFKSYVADINSPQQMEVNQSGVSAQADYKFGDGFQLTSISAYRNWFFLPTNDADSISANAITNAGQAVQDQQVTEELRLASPADRTIEYQVGTFFFFQRQPHDFTFLNYGPDADAWLGSPTGLFSNVNTATFYDPQTNSIAAFGQGTWHISSALSLTAGIRNTFERKAADIDRPAPTGGAPLTGALAGAREAQLGPYYTSQTVRNDQTSELASISYKFSPDVTSYASFSHGAKSGGINPAVPAAGLPNSSLIVAPETANDEELGIKTNLFNRHLAFSADIYHTLVKNYQATILTALSSTSTSVSGFGNVGWVRSQGVETEMNYLPFRDLSVTGFVSYGDTQYKSYYNAPCPAEDPAQAGQPGCSLTGAQLVGAPRWTSGATVTPSHTFAYGYKGYFMAQYAFKSSFFGSSDDSALGRIGAYQILNFRAGLNIKSNWDLSVWADNAFDRRYAATVVAGTNGSYNAYPGFPRVVGGTVRVMF